jgi:hypothetical protein
MKRLLGIIINFLIIAVYKLIYRTIHYIPWVKLYQPIFGLQNKTAVTRECSDRWDAFSCHLPSEKGSVLDIGCNIGYFSFQCAQEGHFSYGVEYHRPKIIICNAIKYTTGIKNCTFIKQYIDFDFISKMPAFNTIINLSLFHHWVKRYGFDHSQDMMKGLAQKCDCMIFETGQSTEAGSQWPEILTFMGSDPEQWIEGFLKEIGFTSVENIGTFSTGLTQTKRFVFVAKK